MKRNFTPHSRWRSCFCLLILGFLSLAGQAQFQRIYTTTVGLDGQNAPLGKSTCTVMESNGTIFDHVYHLQNTNQDCRGFVITKVTEFGVFVDQWRYRDAFTSQDALQAWSMTLSHDGEHLIVVGNLTQNCNFPTMNWSRTGDQLFVAKLRTSDGAMVWMRRITWRQPFPMNQYQELIIAKANVPANSYVIFGAANDQNWPLLKMIGLSVDDAAGAINWSQIYLEVNPNQVWQVMTLPTDLKVVNDRAWVVSERFHFNNTASRIGLFQVNTANGFVLGLDHYRLSNQDRLFHPRLDLLKDGDEGFVISSNDFDDDAIVFRLIPSRTVQWANRIDNAERCMGIFENQLNDSDVDLFIQEAKPDFLSKSAGVLTLDENTGAQLGLVAFKSNRWIVGMDRSNDHRYLLNLDDRLPASGNSLSIGPNGSSYQSAFSPLNDTFNLLRTDNPGVDFVCPEEYEVTINPINLIHGTTQMTNDDWHVDFTVPDLPKSNRPAGDPPCFLLSDGEFKSTVTPVVEKEYTTTNVFPNPLPAYQTAWNLQGRVDQDGTYTIEIRNLLGQLVFSENRLQLAGSMIWQVPAGDLSDGLYLLQLLRDGQPVYERKLVRE